MQEIQALLTAWGSRATRQWGGDKLAELGYEIEILEGLYSQGCLQTQDGLFVKIQLEKRRQQVLEIVKSQSGDILNIPPNDGQNIPPAI